MMRIGHNVRGSYYSYVLFTFSFLILENTTFIFLICHIPDSKEAWFFSRSCGFRLDSQRANMVNRQHSGGHEPRYSKHRTYSNLKHKRKSYTLKDILVLFLITCCSLIFLTFEGNFTSKFEIISL